MPKLIIVGGRPMKGSAPDKRILSRDAPSQLMPALPKSLTINGKK